MSEPRPSSRQTPVVHAPFAERRGAVVRQWWAKAFERSVTEASYDERDLRRGRTIARKAQVGAITLESGRLWAAVAQEDDLFTVAIDLPTLDAEAEQALVEVVAQVAGWVGALMQGDLPRELVESCEELGVELLPSSGDFTLTCGCEAWVQPCVHALAVLTQVNWWMDTDPFVLLRWRGLGREALLVRLHELQEVAAERRGEGSVAPAGAEQVGAEQAGSEPWWSADDVAVALEAAERAAVMLAEFDAVRGSSSSALGR